MTRGGRQGCEGSIGSSYLLVGSREVVEAGSKEGRKTDLIRRFTTRQGLPTPRPLHTARPLPVPAHRGHVDVVWVARVVIGAGRRFCSLGFSCERKHTWGKPQPPALPSSSGPWSHAERFPARHRRAGGGGHSLPDPPHHPAWGWGGGYCHLLVVDDQTTEGDLPCPGAHS